jgi:hypothetical protein
MNIKQQIETDLKEALLAKNSLVTTTLRGVKSVILNAEIAAGKREEGLSEDELTALLQKEAKKRQESADLYNQAGATDRAETELAEKVVIEAYLPAQLSEDEVREKVMEAIAKTGASEPKDMGKVIGMVKESAGATADGAVIARIAKEALGGDK